jgi:hypothetical protein
MRNSYAMPKTCRTKSLAGKQAVCYGGAIQAMQLFKQQASLLKSTFFARDIYGYKHLGGRQNAGKSIHILLGIMHRT